MSLKLAFYVRRLEKPLSPENGLRELWGKYPGVWTGLRAFIQACFDIFSPTKWWLRAYYARGAVLGITL